MPRRSKTKSSGAGGGCGAFAWTLSYQRLFPPKASKMDIQKTTSPNKRLFSSNHQPTHIPDLMPDSSAQRCSPERHTSEAN